MHALDFGSPFEHTSSVSGDASYRKHVFAMADFLVGELESLGVEVTKVDLGKHTLDGEELPLPPALLGKLGDDPKKKTILLYAHYDVQPVREPGLHCKEVARLNLSLHHSLGSLVRWYVI